MPCYHPMQAWYAKTPNEGGKYSLVFNRTKAHPTKKPLDISCGQCVGCRLEKSRQWATRCVHEASLHPINGNCFITLTYSDEGLQLREQEYVKTNHKRALKDKPPIDVPHKYTIATRDFQLFMKRLRKKFGSQIRFYQCGEYGETCKTCNKSQYYCNCRTFIPQLGRPHYHACLFNFTFPDMELHSLNNSEDKLYTSKSLEKLWPYGFATVGEVTFASAAYTARYLMKKINGDLAHKHYQKIDHQTGEIVNLKPEYTTMSGGGSGKGIGHNWYLKFNRDLYPSDYIIVNSKKCTVPKYYDAQLEKFNPHLYDKIKLKRENSIDKNHPDLTDDRLKVREQVTKLKIKQLTRKV